MLVKAMFVITIHAKPEYDEYMQHQHMSII